MVISVFVEIEINFFSLRSVLFLLVQVNGRGDQTLLLGSFPFSGLLDDLCCEYFYRALCYLNKLSLIEKQKLRSEFLNLLCRVKI